jgi:hypothetical protein
MDQPTGCAKQEVGKMLSFTVSGHYHGSVESYSTNTIAEAIDKASEMSATGLKDVTIKTSDGRVYREADFRRLIKVREKYMPRTGSVSV